MNYTKHLALVSVIIFSSIEGMSDKPVVIIAKNKLRDRLVVKIENKKRIVDLSGLQLQDKDIKHIDTLQVKFENKNVPIASLPAFALLLNDNELTSLPEGLENLSNLQYLDLKKNNLTTLGDSITQLKNLIFLDLGNNKLTLLPDLIGALNKLKFLYLNDNQLESLPTSLANLSSLKFLNLNDNAFKAVPNEVGLLTGLNILNLHNNPFLQEPAQVIGQVTKTADSMIWKKKSLSTSDEKSKL